MSLRFSLSHTYSLTALWEGICRTGKEQDLLCPNLDLPSHLSAPRAGLLTRSNIPSHFFMLLIQLQDPHIEVLPSKNKTKQTFDDLGEVWSGRMKALPQRVTSRNSKDGNYQKWQSLSQGEGVREGWRRRRLLLTLCHVQFDYLIFAMEIYLLEC